MAKQFKVKHGLMVGDGGASITGSLATTSNIFIPNSSYLQSKDGGATIYNLIGVHSNGHVRVGQPNRALEFYGSSTSGQQGIWFYEGSSAIMLLKGGNVGIGTTSPSEKLHIQGTFGNNTFKVRPNADHTIISADQELRVGTTNSADIFIAPNGIKRATFKADGSVGIGTSSPDAALDVVSNGSGNGINLRSNSVNAYSQIKFNNNAGDVNTASIINYIGSGQNDFAFRLLSGAGTVERMRITGTGNVGIGTTSPAEKLHVDGRIRATGLLLNTGERFIGITNNGISFLSTNESSVTSTSTNIVVGRLALGSTYSTIDIGAYNKATQGYKTAIWGDTSSDHFRIYSSSLENLLNVENAGDVTIAKNLTVGGRVTAQEFHTEFVSASILYQSGSTKFGDTFDDDHNFTGSINLLNNKGGSNSDILTVRADYGEIFNVGKGNITMGPSSRTDGSTTIQGGDLYVKGHSATNLYVSSSGNVGIGTTSPSEQLHVDGNVRLDGGVYSGNLNYLELNPGSSDSLISQKGGGNFLIIRGNNGVKLQRNSGTSVNVVLGEDAQKIVGEGSADSMAFFTANTEKLRIIANGNIGIGTTAPVNKLQVVGNALFDGNRGVGIDTTSGIVSISGNSSGWATGYYFKGSSGTSRGGFGGYGTADNLSYYWIGDTYVSPTMIIKPNAGNIGIGTTIPDYKLHIADNGAATINLSKTDDDQWLRLTGGNGGTQKIQAAYNLEISSNPSVNVSSDMIFKTQGSTKMYISGSGKVGIGTTDPVRGLDVRGNAFIGGTPVNAYGGTLEIYQNGSSSTLVIHEDAGTSTAGIHIRRGGNDTWLQNQGNGFEIRTEGTNTGAAPLTIDGVGDVTLGYDLVVGGIVTAQEFHTEYVSASIVYQSGSTKFGDTADDVHQFTGSVDVFHPSTYGAKINLRTSLHKWTLEGGETGYSANSLALDYDGSTFIRMLGTSDVRIGAGVSVGSMGYTAPTNGLYVYGNTGLGTTTPQAKLHVSGTSDVLLVEGSGSTLMDIQGSQGQLFSVVDSLSGSLMSVNDISGLPIFEVSSDDKVVMGEFGTNALVVTGSKVGIGTSTPNATLYVDGNSGATATFRGLTQSTVNLEANTVDNYIVGTTSGTFSFRPAGTERLRVDSTGIEIPADGKLGTTNNAYNYIKLYNGVDASMFFRIGHPTVGRFGFLNGSDTEVFTVDARNERVGIGTTTPTRKLHVVSPNNTNAFGIDIGEDASYRFSANSNSGYTTTFHMDNTGLDIGHDSNVRSINLQTHSTDRLTIAGGGNVGIGTTSPRGKLTIGGGGHIIGDSSFRIGSTGTGNTPETAIKFTDTALTYYVANSIKMFMSSSGDIGIGTTTPSEKLDVNGNIKISGNDQFIYGPSNTENIRFYTPGNQIILSATNGIRFGSNIILDGPYKTIYSNNGFGYITFYNQAYDGFDRIIRHYEPIVKENGAEPAIISRSDLEFRIDSNNDSTTSAFKITKDAGTELMRVNEAGNVGIGTTAPTKTLDVRGSSLISGSFSGTDAHALTLVNTDSSGNPSIMRMVFAGEGGNEALQIGMYSSPATKPVYFQSTQGSGWGNIVFQRNGGSVGIGTDLPTQKLHVDGNVSASLYYGDGENLTNVQRIPKVEYLELTSNVSTNDELTLPNGLEYTLSANGYEYLEVFMDGIRLNRTLDYAEVDPTSVRYLLNVPSGSVITYKSLTLV